MCLVFTFFSFTLFCWPKKNWNTNKKKLYWNTNNKPHQVWAKVFYFYTICLFSTIKPQGVLPAPSLKPWTANEETERISLLKAKQSVYYFFRDGWLSEKTSPRLEVKFMVPYQVMMICFDNFPIRTKKTVICIRITWPKAYEKRHSLFSTSQWNLFLFCLLCISFIWNFFCFDSLCNFWFITDSLIK